MNLLRQTFRLWWQKPRRYADQEDERSVTFLELFYDLVYVVVVAELAHSLAAHVSLTGLGEFAFLFSLVWWAWLNGTLYHDLHGNNDIRTRIFTFAQMFCVASMAVFAHGAMGSGSVGFAISYAAFLLILAYLWWRSGVHDPDHRPLSIPYSLAFVVATLLFALSPLVEGPLRFIMWGVAMAPPFVMIFVLIKRAGKNELLKKWLDGDVWVSEALIERFGLFTIIVLGEVMVGVVQGVAAQHDITVAIGATAWLGMSIAIGCWWLYFDFISTRRPVRERILESVWIYAHLPSTIGIVAIGAAVMNVVSHSGTDLEHDVRWLLVGSIGLTLITFVLLMKIIVVPEHMKEIASTARKVTFLSAVAVILLGFTRLETLPLLVALNLLLLAPVFTAFRLWIRRASPGVGDPEGA